MNFVRGHRFNSGGAETLENTTNFRIPKSNLLKFRESLKSTILTKSVRDVTDLKMVKDWVMNISRQESLIPVNDSLVKKYVSKDIIDEINSKILQRRENFDELLEKISHTNSIESSFEYNRDDLKVKTETETTMLSKYMGVVYCNRGKFWKVYVPRVSGSRVRQEYVGHYDDEKTAALIYDCIARQRFKERAVTNFPFDDQELSTEKCKSQTKRRKRVKTEEEGDTSISQKRVRI